MKLLPTNNLQWRTATKTKRLLAKHFSSLMHDQRLISKLLIDTLEGKEGIKANSIICMGDLGDVWQQAPAKLLAKYDIKEFDVDGWMVCLPKPGNESYCYQVTAETLHLGQDILHNGGHLFAIIGQYGEQTEHGLLQTGTIGDYILQDPKNPADSWIVQKTIFENTYAIKPS
jgi:hypothetical protein